MGLLRLFLAYVVVLFHSPIGILTRYSHPALAVQCFYVISGFYMQLIVKKYYDANNTSWKMNFYSSRALRIFPLYYFFLIANIVFVYQMHLPQHLSSFVDTSDFKGALTFITTNLLIFGQSALRFFAYDTQAREFLFVGTTGHILETTKNAASFHMMIPSWSIDVELMFYLLAPFLLLRSTALIIIAALISLSIRLWLGFKGYNLYSWGNAFFPSELAVFLMGSLSCRFYMFCKNKSYNKIYDVDPFIKTIKSKFSTIEKKFSKNKNLIIHICYFSAIFFLIRFYAHGWHHISGGSWNEGIVAVPDKYWISIIITAISLPLLFGLTKDMAWDRLVGNLSYPVYLGHPTIIYLLEKSTIDPKYHSLYAFLSITLISIPLVIFIESYITNFRHKKFLKHATK